MNLDGIIRTETAIISGNSAPRLHETTAPRRAARLGLHAVQDSVSTIVGNNEKIKSKKNWCAERRKRTRRPVAEVNMSSRNQMFVDNFPDGSAYVDGNDVCIYLCNTAFQCISLHAA